ncbi:hypothetical protein [Cohnella cholangitidis]|uniref:Copper amine oxidase N-terminal domain-containing protein n=1 Tax=Cohnella cholangitidis TaxID=2598458 RepID=A0A7G5C262_9BACL|nr:hypothetical protein [Cohnella cholangitidis]QMV43296.1 hypothetical protein FPL14_20530 [Cohnella cholangitidis]
MNTGIRILLSLSIMASMAVAAPIGITAPQAAVAATTQTKAMPATSTVYVNGQEMQSDLYTISICKKVNATDHYCDINDDLYVKLRDFAKTLQGTDKEFAVGYDSAKKKMNLLSGKAYKPVGGELKKTNSESLQNAKPSDAGLLLDGQAATATAYTIKGSTYYKLRDLCTIFKLPVSTRTYDNSIRIHTYGELSTTLVAGNTLERSSVDYNYSNWFSPSKRFLYISGGQLQVLEASETRSQLIIHSFSSDYKELGQKKVPMELPLFGGFHQSQDGNYYVIYGQNNREDSDRKVVYRVVKYDNSWKKIAQVDITDVYVSEPFHASNVTMDSYNDKLIIHSGRLRYLTDDGLRHQSNISFLIDTKTMTVLEQPMNHVSHSFATYVRFDGNRIVYVDHGDAWPRSIVLQVESNGGIEQTVDLITFPGKLGDNYTGANLGGLEVASLNDLIVGADSGTKGTKNVFLSVVPKNAQQSSDVKTIWLTNYTTKSSVRIKNQTHLVKLSDNKFVVMWEELTEAGEPTVVYAVIDGSGSIIQKPKKLPGVPSPGNMMPLVQNGNLTWYYSQTTDLVEWYTLRIQ